jgi:hypothetical protein
MSLIHFVHGEKGGVGKSFFARLLVEYCIEKKLEFTLVETDRSNPDVGDYYQEICERVFFSEDEKRSYDVDLIFDLSEVKPVIVNLPAQVEVALTDWIGRNGLADELSFTDNDAQNDLKDDDRVLIYKWFLCTGEPDSIKLFKESVTSVEGKIPHILVKNMLYELNWERFNQEQEDRHDKEVQELQIFVKEHNVKVLELPKLHKKDADLIVFDKLRFSQAVISPSVSRLAQRRLAHYLELVYEAITATGLMTPELFIKHRKTQANKRTKPSKSSKNSSFEEQEKSGDEQNVA